MTPVTVNCRSCGESALRTPDGTLLEKLTHGLGIHKPDGSKLTGREIRAGGRGHRRHVCPPGGQGALFEAGAS